jgi:hypothetical protein
VSPVILALDLETYTSALVALEQMAAFLGECAIAEKMLGAAKDLRKAHALYLAYDARIATPALLRRQI